MLTAELATAFQSLEGLVMSGRQSIAQEQQRQAAVRADNAAVLEKNLQRLAKQHSAEVRDAGANFVPCASPDSDKHSI